MRRTVGRGGSELSRLRTGNLDKICVQADLRAGTCPKKSIYGRAKAWTPLLDKPLEGPLYLGVGFGYKLPALVADLNGQIRTMLVGRVDTAKRDGIRNTFEVVPDAPCKKSDHPRYCQKVVDSITKLKFIPRNDSGRAARRAKFGSFDSASVSEKPGHKPKKKSKHKKKGGIRISGSMRRGGNPALRAVLTTHQGPDSATPEANIARVSVALPHSAFLDQSHIRTICTRVQFAEGNGHGSNCPAGSIYGHARGITPLLGYPLEGNVYLRSSDNPLPDLVPVLEGPAWQPLAIVLVDRIDSKNGGIRTTFDYVPDAPVSKFILDMQGGKKGLIQNSRNLCNSTAKATVNFTGQNGKASSIRPVVRPECPKKKHKKRRGHSKPKHKKG